MVELAVSDRAILIGRPGIGLPKRSENSTGREICLNRTCTVLGVRSATGQGSPVLGRSKMILDEGSLKATSTKRAPITIHTEDPSRTAVRSYPYSAFVFFAQPGFPDRVDQVGDRCELAG